MLSSERDENDSDDREPEPGRLKPANLLAEDDRGHHYCAGRVKGRDHRHDGQQSVSGRDEKQDERRGAEQAESEYGGETVPPGEPRAGAGWLRSRPP